jgi:hypothetical protein
VPGVGLQPALGCPVLAALLLALTHLVAGRLHGGRPARPSWLSAASGLSVAYVFIDLLPELAEAQTGWLEARPRRLLFWFESQVYLAALIGTLLALGLHRATGGAHGSRQRFWLQIGSFALYNVLIGASTVRLVGVLPMLLAVLALGGHFLVNDYSLSAQHGRTYDRVGRWILAVAVVVGWLLATLVRWPVVVNSALLGLLSGGIVLNILKEELHTGRELRFSAFAIGALAYAALLITLGYSLGVA